MHRMVRRQDFSLCLIRFRNDGFAMCLILFAYRIHADYPLVLAANRDENYARPTQPAGFWDDQPRIYGGRDLESGGTWLGINNDGAFAAVTNFRDGNAARHSTRSRGELVADYLRNGQSPASYVTEVSAKAGEYNGFNLLAGNIDELHWLSNRSDAPSIVKPGVHGLSNHLLDTPWPKVELGRTRVTALLDRHENELIDGLFQILAERTIAPDDTLPETGVGLARERVLSPAFIASSSYGTRASTVVLIDKRRTVTFVERSYTAGGTFAGSTSNRFTLDQRVAAV